jgi:hypothetical protein
MLIVAVLLATVLLRFTIVFAVVYLILPKSFSCPRCADKLALIHHPILRRLVPQVEHRWCLGCGWSGLARRMRDRRRTVRQSRVIIRAARS